MRHLSEKKGAVLRLLISMSIPTMIEEIMRVLLQYVDTAMVGQLGQQATAAVSTTTTINWLIYSVPYSVEVAVMALAAKAYGAGYHRQIKKIASQALYLSLLLGVSLTALCLSLSPFIPIWMGVEESVRRPATEYFFIISLPLMLRVMNALFGGIIRATKDTKSPMIINLSANFLNIGLNALFIYGLGMGVNGAGVASAISYSLSGVAMVFLVIRRGWLVKERELMRWDGRIVGKTMKIAFPAIGTSVTSCLGYVVFAGMVSGMGTVIFAAHSIAVTAEELFYIPGYGLRVATASLVGNAIGEGNQEKQSVTEVESIFLTVGLMVLSGILLFFIAEPLMRLFTSSSEVAALGAEMLRLVALTEPFFGLMVVIEGIFYGQGKTRGVFLIETVSMWGIRIVFTWLVINLWHLSLREVWYCMIADNLTKAALLLVMYLCSKRKV